MNCHLNSGLNVNTNVERFLTPAVAYRIPVINLICFAKYCTYTNGRGVAAANC